jgi:chromosome partitioning protein
VVSHQKAIFLLIPRSLLRGVFIALLTATEVYIPIAMTYFALEGVDQVMHTINAVKRSLDHSDLQITGVIATFFDGRTRLSHEILENIRTYFGEVVFQATIRKNVKLDEAQSHHQSVFDYAPKSTGAIEYGSLVEEVIHRESTCPRRKSAGETSR